VVEKRRFARAPIDAPLTFFRKDTADKFSGVAKDVSLGGMYIETREPAPFNTEVIVHVALPGAEEAMALPGVVRWVRSDGMGVQFGLLGAIETHVIIEIGRRAGTC
jgi:Tfp pilus assembly protein PilZ